MTKPYLYILSGGVDPESNHYSQYLQALYLNEYRMHEKLPGLVQFGAGYTLNTPDTLLHDVSQVVVDGDQRLTHYIQGEIPNNRPATYEEVKTVFNELQSHKWKSGDSFILFVGDHGAPNSYNLECYDFNSDKDGRVNRIQNYQDSLINLWSPGLDLFPENNSLNVSQLDQFLSSSIPQNLPTVAIMTQCYSGGFHRMAYHFDAEGFPVRDDKQNIVAFTAIHDKTTAAGCTSFVDNDRYDGYERRIVEVLTGTNIVTGEKTNSGEPAILAAHLSASLLDRTKDTPLRTSEAFALDYYEALVESDENLQTTLNQKWTEKPNSTVDLPFKNETLIRDDTRRLEYIRNLEAKIKTWFPNLKNQNLSQDLSSIENSMTVIENLETSTEDLIYENEKKFKTMAGPIVASYLEAVKSGKLGDNIKMYETLYLLLPNESERLMASDPTLTSLSEYNNYISYRYDHIFQWAKSNPEYEETIQELSNLKKENELLDDQSSEFEIQYACLQRIHQQMRILTLHRWLSEQNDERSQKALTDISLFIENEENARFK